MDAYAALTEGCGLVDRSETGKLALTGPDAKEVLDGQVSNDVVALEPGAGLYAAFLTPKGKMLGDLRVLDRGSELLLLTERVALQALFDLLRRGLLGWQAELHKRTVEMGLLSLIGPRAAQVAGADVPDAEHAHVPWGDGGVAVRTADGVDVIVPAGELEAARAALVAAGAVEVSDGDAEIVRIERGRPRYGVDIGEDVMPAEAGIVDRAVSFTKGCYVGQETVARLHWRGKPNRHLRALRADAPLTVGAALVADGREVGRVTSAAISPAAGPVGLGLVRREVEPGAIVDAGGVGATVVALPAGAPA